MSSASSSVVRRDEFTSKYKHDFEVPQAFPKILRDFTREILKDEPKEIERYGYDYFMQQMKTKQLQLETADD